MPDAPDTLRRRELAAAQNDPKAGVVRASNVARPPHDALALGLLDGSGVVGQELLIIAAVQPAHRRVANQGSGPRL
eukprot:14779517-Alexandrium_andersonii.AAC.1